MGRQLYNGYRVNTVNGTYDFALKVTLYRNAIEHAIKCLESGDASQAHAILLDVVDPIEG